MPTAQHLTEIQEKQEYDKHENQVDDVGYRKFLSRLSTPLIKRLPAGCKVLDFGCGDGPALIAMLCEQGFRAEGFDIFYKNTPEVLQQNYQAICLTEVIEHLNNPKPILLNLWQQLNTGGILAIMTKTVINPQRFSQWHYKNDPTHIAFYSDATFNYLVGVLNAEFIGVDNDVFFFIKL